MTNETILIRIQRLLDLASNNTNVNESAAAFAQAQKLLTRHNLDLATVAAATGIKQASEAIINSTEPLYTGQRVVLWKNNLAVELCEINACKMYISTTVVNNKKQISYRIVGTSSDVMVVRYFFNSIVEQIEMLSANALRSGLGQGKTFTNNFKHGAQQTVIERLQKMHEEVRAEYAQTAIVLVDNKIAEVEAWVKTNMNLGAPHPSHTTTSDSRGFALGKEAGKNVSLARGLDAGTKES
jgi:hypothetical protein